MKFEIKKLSKYPFLGIWTIVWLFKLLSDTKINNCVIVSISKFVKILVFFKFFRILQDDPEFYYYAKYNSNDQKGYLEQLFTPASKGNAI